MRTFQLSAVAIAIASLALATPRLATATEYHWTPVGPTTWPAPGNWTPTRTTPLATDRLVFDSGTSVSVTGVPNQTIGQLVVTNGTFVNLNAAATGNALTIAGDTGPDFEITASSRLFLAGANALLINLGTGATGAIAGRLTALGGAHRLQALDADAIEFTSGGTAIGSLGFTGNLFGTGTGASALNSVRFKAGSTYVQVEGGNPFGAGQPSSVIIYEPGSLYRLDGSLTTSLSGRTFANVEYNGPGTGGGLGGFPCSMDSIVINSGLFAIELTGVFNIRGSIHVRGSGVLKLGPSTGAVTYTMNGAVEQALTDSSSVNPGIVFQTPVKLAIDNPAGVRYVRRALTIPGQLEFVHGVVSGFLILGNTGTTLGGSASSGWFNGYISASISPGNPNRSFPVGTDLAYMPVDLAVHGVTTPFTALASAFRPLAFPSSYYVGSQLDTLQDANYFCNIDLEDSTAWSNFDVVLGFSAPDIDPGADPNAFVVRRKSFRFTNPGPNLLTWHSSTTTTRTASSINALGVTRDAPGDQRFQFLIGEPSVVRISVYDSARTEPTGPNLPLKFRVALSEPAVDPVAVNYTTAPGTAVVGDYGTTAGTLSFAPGGTSLEVPVPIIGDATPEADETFSLVLSSPFRGVLDDSVATGTILDDDDATPPTVSVLTPNGGETVVAGSIVNLDWSASDNVAVEAVDLALSRDDGANWEPIASGLANTGTYAWTSTGPSTQLARLRVIASDHHAQLGQDVSDAAWEITDAVAVEPTIPLAFALDLVSGNPSRGASRIRYALPRDQTVRLVILDVRGRIVASLAGGAEPAGMHEVVWDGRTASGAAASGVYFVQIQTEEWKAQRRLVHLR